MQVHVLVFLMLGIFIRKMQVLSVLPLNGDYDGVDVGS